MTINETSNKIFRGSDRHPEWEAPWPNGYCAVFRISWPGSTLCSWARHVYSASLHPGELLRILNNYSVKLRGISPDT